MKELSVLPEKRFRIVPDAIRYTFQYREAHYTQGVWADIDASKRPRF